MMFNLENPGLSSIMNVCLNLIQKERSDLKRTHSQTPATSELWFLESGLKNIKSLRDFLSWLKEKFSPQYKMHQLNTNTHVIKIYDALAAVIVTHVQQSIQIDKEDREIIVQLITNAQMNNSPDSSLPSTADNSPTTHVGSPHQENWSDLINRKLSSF
ncbi:MAG: hypothetical protein M3R00_00045 [Pseudomonadota bacterium]|nr:hypothetical protein [Pseudomonadota bacterium]